MELEFPQKFVGQPVCPVTLDRRHPLARNLIYSIYNSAFDVGKPPRDYVSGSQGVLTGTSRTTAQLPSGPLMHAQTYNGTSSDSCSHAGIQLWPAKAVLVSFWLWWNSYGTAANIACAFGNDTTSQTGFYLTPDSGTNSWIGGPFANNTFSRYTIARASAAAWHHYAFLFDLTLATQQFAAAWVDGRQVTRSVQTQNMGAGATFDNLTLYLMRDGGAGGAYSAGRMMNFNIHNLGRGGALGYADRLVEGLYRRPWAMFRPAMPMYAFPAAPAATFAAHRFQLAC